LEEGEMPRDAAEKEKALAIAQELGPAEAARATGIPAGTIRSWLCRLQRNDGTQRNSAAQRNTPKLREAQQRVMEKAVADAGEYITERLKGLADRLYGLAEKAVGKIDTAIADPAEAPKGKRPEDHNRDGAAWVRSLVGVLAQAIDKAQLLSGKPTARPEVSERHTYDVTQRIVTERPDLIDAIFADHGPGLADRRREGAPIGLGLPGRSDLPEA
jgi:transposase-like protein